jgi:Co/Zn/Cd efflux system component
VRSLGARQVESVEADEPAPAVSAPEGDAEARTLWTVLAINAAMFVVEGVAGSAVPDLVIGTAIAALVLRGAVRILRL